MKYAEAKQGRIFVMRLEDGETVHAEIEKFAREQAVSAGALLILGGADKGSRLVVGPERGEVRPVIPMAHVFDNVREIAGVGTLFPDADGNPTVHMHMACGRNADTATGCIRGGVQVWQIMEIVLFELLDTGGKRVLDPALGFKLLTF